MTFIPVYKNTIKKRNSFEAILISGGTNLWLSTAFNWSLIQTSSLTCKIFPFFTYTMLDFSVWLIVITTGEKLFAVSQPLYAHSLKMNAKKSVCFVIITLIICSAINSHFLITHTIIDFKLINQTENNHMVNNTEPRDLSTCSYSKWNRFYEEYWSYIDATIYSFLPFLLISVFNVLVIIYLKRAEKNISKYKLQYRKSSIPNQFIVNLELDKLNKTSTNFYKRRKKNFKLKSLKSINRRLTLTVLFINISFCILSSPMVILQIVQLNREDAFDINNKSLDLFLAIAEILQYFNHTTNFFFYCLSATNFREEAKMCFTCLQYFKRRGRCK